jgi:hypothetical protein
MATLHFKATTTATPAQFVAALTDFGPGRAEVFENSTDDELKVHSQGPTEADVTEGSKGIWERSHYDWSDPNRVVLTTTDSNTWSNKSGHTYVFKPAGDGKTEVEYTVVRDGKTVKGKLLGVVVGTVGRGVLKKAFEHAVAAIEARGGDAAGAGATTPG